MNFAVLLAAPFIAYAAIHGVKLGFTVLSIFARRPLAGLAFLGFVLGGVSLLPPDVRAEVEYRADALIAAPADLGDLFGDLASIVEDGNTDIAQAIDYGDEELASLYTHETDRYGQTYMRILARLMETFDDLGELLALEDSDLAEAPGDV